jgi:polysaccharide chain length determinant protein (PEP-CTERM system associated)
MEELFAQLLSFMKGVWKYRWHAVVIAWVVLVISWVKIYTMPNVYQSSARVYVDTQTILKPLLSGMTSMPNVEQQVSIMSRTLISRPNVERVIRTVDLDLKTQSTKDHDRLVDKLMSQIKVTGTSNDDIYSISYANEDPQIVKNVVQSLLTIFLEGSYGDKKQDSVNAVRFIDNQIKDYESRLVSAENKLKDFRLQNGELLSRQGSDYGTKVEEVQDKLNQAKLDLAEAEQARNSIRKQIFGEEPAPGKPGTRLSVANPEIDARIDAINKNLDTLRLQFTEQHPDIVSARRLISQLEARKIEEAKTRKNSGDSGRNLSPVMQQLKIALSDAEAKAASMRARVDEYAARIERLKAASKVGPEIESQLSQLNRDYQINKSNYEKLVASRESAKLSGNLSATSEMINFRIIDPPVLPSAPVGPNRPLLVSLAFIASLLAGLAGALLMSQIRPTFMSPASLREVTGLTVLGTVAINLTEHEIVRRRKGMLGLGLAVGVLVLVYGAAMARLLIKI